MTKLCLRCGEHPVADEEPPRFPFCESCWPVVASQGNYFVDEAGNFDRFMSEAEIAESYRQSVEAALAMAEEEDWIVPEPRRRPSMARDQLLSRLANPLIDAAADIQSDIVAQSHRSPTLDRLRRTEILYRKLAAMVRALTDGTGARSEHDTGYAMLTALINQIDADERAVRAEIHQHVLAASALANYPAPYA